MAELNIDRYLGRIGARRPGSLTAEALRGLTRAHLEQVPFENLEVTETKREPSLQVEDLYDKVVNQRRGGYCFELNKLFYHLLKDLGFACHPVAVRVVMGRPEPCPYSHRGTVVELDGKRWYCDVGFGGLGPKGIIDMDHTGIQTIVGERFRVVWENGTCVVIRVDPDKETRMLAFRDESWLDVDFKYWNGYFATYPHSPFRNKRIAYLCTPTGWISLVDRVYTCFEAGVTASQELPDEATVRGIIQEKFGLMLPQWDNG